MKKLIHYLKPALFNIRQNKPYAVFCILGTALTFIFVIFCVQITFTLTGDYPPSVNTGRTVKVDNFKDTEGNHISLLPAEINPFLEHIAEYESYSIVHYTTMYNVLINNDLYLTIGTPVNAGFWKIYEYKFIAGRPFTEDDCYNRKKYAIITKNFSKTAFRTWNSTGKKLQLDGDEFEIIGIVDDVSLMASPTFASEIWLPADLISNPNQTNILEILFPKGMDLQKAKEKVIQAAIHTFEQRNIQANITLNNLQTIKESKSGQFGFIFGAGVLVFIFLLIPAVNIISLNISNTNNRAEEIAVRRTFGAGRLSSFLQIMCENILLAVTGTLIGILGVTPFMRWVQNTFFSDFPMLNGSPLMAGVDFYVIITVVIPLMVLFVLMFSGIPAYLITKRNITNVLRGGTK